MPYALHAPNITQQHPICTPILISLYAPQYHPTAPNNTLYAPQYQYPYTHPNITQQYPTTPYMHPNIIIPMRTPISPNSTHYALHAPHYHPMPCTHPIITLCPARTPQIGWPRAAPTMGDDRRIDHISPRRRHSLSRAARRITDGRAAPEFR